MSKARSTNARPAARRRKRWSLPLPLAQKLHEIEGEAIYAEWTAYKEAGIQPPFRMLKRGFRWKVNSDRLEKRSKEEMNDAHAIRGDADQQESSQDVSTNTDITNEEIN